MKRFVAVLARLVATLTLFVSVADGVLSVLMAARWLEIQRTHTPSWYARLPSALLPWPDPVLRLIGGFQAAVSVFLLTLLR